MIREQESNRALKGVRRSPSIKKSDAEKKVLKIQRAFNTVSQSKATRPLLDGGNYEHSVNINFSGRAGRGQGDISVKWSA